ncbi:MAG: LytTR family DNA-binding domain-containing protein [Lachnospiraceae bacterium]|jgi:DNA-binding LytR/AlgR family response regulator|nr:LytTR family DNA-binding domain-containing protein [Lachnospiraceae bacterium]
MKIKIAICDDCESIGFQLDDLVRKICKNQEYCAGVEIYSKGEHLCRDLEAGIKYDLIFLDIELKSDDVNGVAIGKKMREEYNDIMTQIIYISGKESYALSLFQNNPFDFLVKPIDDEYLKKTMTRFLMKHQKPLNTFMYNYGGESHMIEVKNIIYLRSEGAKVILVLDNNQEEFYYGSLAEAYNNQLAKYDFLYIHRSFIVNYNYITKFSPSKCLMSNKQSLQIAQNRRQDISERFNEIKNGRA